MISPLNFDSRDKARDNALQIIRSIYLVIVSTEINRCFLNVVVYLYRSVCICVCLYVCACMYILQHKCKGQSTAYGS